MKLLSLKRFSQIALGYRVPFNRRKYLNPGGLSVLRRIKEDRLVKIIVSSSCLGRVCGITGKYGNTQQLTI